MKEIKLKVARKVRKIKKIFKKRDFWVKVVVIISAGALIAASVLPYLLI